MELKRNTEPIRMRNYGRIIQAMVGYACRMPDSKRRQALVIYIAQCMRQKNISWNKDQDAGISRVKADIHRLSDGRLNCDFPGFDEKVQARKPEMRQQQQQQGNKKKKNK